MSLCIVYLASPFLFRLPNSTVSRFLMLKASVEQTRKCFPTTDIFVFHEDYTSSEISAIPEVTEFIQVDFRGFEDVYNKSLPQSRGYLMMCRFFSGVVQYHPRLQSYTHYMRLDDDSFFQEPYPSSKSVEAWLSHDYVYRSLFQEAHDQSSLFAFTMDFLRTEFGIPFQLNYPRLLASLEALNVVRNGRYTGIAPYNNFHTSSFRLWRTPLVQKYIGAIETSKNIFRKGWLDANIHAMIVFVLSQFVQANIAADFTFGYRHNAHVSRLQSPRVEVLEGIEFFPGLKERTPWLDPTISPEELAAPDVVVPRAGKLVFVCFANTEYMTLDRIVAHAKHLNVFDTIFPYTELDFPEFFAKHRDFIRTDRRIGYGRWIWKPKIILETLRKLNPDDILVYADAGVHLNKRGLPRFAEYVSLLQDSSKSIVSFVAQQYRAEQFVCPDAAAAYFPEVYSKPRPHCYGGVMLLKQSAESIRFVEEWLALCENYNFLRGISKIVHPEFLGGDGDNGLYTLCLAKHESIVHTIAPDEAQPLPPADWSMMASFPFHYRRNRPTR